MSTSMNTSSLLVLCAGTYLFFISFILHVKPRGTINQVSITIVANHVLVDFACYCRSGNFRRFKTTSVDNLYSASFIFYQSLYFIDKKKEIGRIYHLAIYDFIGSHDVPDAI